MAVEHFIPAHGGDIYAREDVLDFSVNINPLMTPKGVLRAYEGSAGVIHHYPDIRNRELKAATAEYFGLGQGCICLGNGVSELIMTFMSFFSWKSVIMPSPDFTGFIRAFDAYGVKPGYVSIIRDEELTDGEETVLSLLEKLKETCGGKETRDTGTHDACPGLDSSEALVVLTNPNNPAGRLIKSSYLHHLLEECRKFGAFLAVDESFLMFTEEGNSNSLSGLVKEGGLAVFRSFTKLFAMPGIRLGAMLSDEETVKSMELKLPEWNISAGATAAGLAALKEEKYIKDTHVYVKRERDFLTGALRSAGIKVFPSESDHILIKSERPLYDLLLKKGILIRDCREIPGLTEGYYRIAVRDHDSNVMLIKALETVVTK